MTSTPTLPSLTASFDRWAPVYDTQLNPLLHLEHRHLPTLLPDLTGKDVLDIGCGTGRWLQHLESLAPRTLTGIDPSPAMLEQARAKLLPTTHLQQADACHLPLPDSSQDLILCSFVLGYLDDLDLFARECHRVLRPGGHLLLSDMHPTTATEHNWTRGFHDGEVPVLLPAAAQTIAHIIATLHQHEITVKTLLEPSFGPPEQPIFHQTDKQSLFESLHNTPVIYLLKLQKSTPVLQLRNAPTATSPTTWQPAISSPATHNSIDLSGYVLLPGLINAHDHLEFALFPNLANPPYRNATEWAHDIHHRHADLIHQHLQVPLRTRLYWGAIRNLLCGVTTVFHHNPHHHELKEPTFPLPTLPQAGWAHSLAFDPLLNQRFADTPLDQPFFVHAAEGTDRPSREEIHELDRRGLLTPRTLLIHGLALSYKEINLLNQRRSSLVLCPTSNRFLFHRILHPSLLAQVQRLAIGSDSPLTAQGDLLDELQLLRASHSIPPERLYTLVTSAPILHLAPNSNLFAMRSHHITPAEILAQASFINVELVVIAGQVQLASADLYHRLPEPHRTGLHPLLVNGHLRWIRADVPSLLDSAESILGRDQLRLGGKEIRRAL